MQNKELIETDGQLQIFIEKYGDFSLAYNTIQERMQYFISEHGFISYREMSGVSVVLADPLCNPDHKSSLIDDFLEKHPRCIFVQCSSSTAKYLKSKTLNIMPFGEEHHINPKLFSTSWRDHKSLKRSLNYYQRVGAVTVELSDITVHQSDIIELKTKWLKSRRSKSEDQYFLTRPLSLTNQKDLRHFALYDGDEMIAYAQCDPIYKNEKILGYYLSQSLFDPSYKHSSISALILGVIEKLKSEGCEGLSLGVTPFCYCNEFSNNGLLASVFQRLALSVGQLIYNFKGLYQLKNGFKSQKKQTFIASNSRIPIKEMFVVAKLVLRG